MKVEIFSFLHDSSIGILHSLFNSTNYWNMFEFQATSYNSNRYPKNAFNFSIQEYWFGNTSSIPNNISFCFKYFSVKLTGYQITTSHISHSAAFRAKKWVFSVSNDNINWYSFDPVTKELNPSQSYYDEVLTNSPYRCFQLTTIEATNHESANRFDLANIDVFGTVIYIPNTCKTKIMNKITYFLFMYQMILKN